MKGNLKLIVDSMMSEKNFDQETVYNIIEASLISAYKKKYGKGLENGIVKFEKATDSYGLFAEKLVVDDDDLYSSTLEIELKDAILIKPDAKVGDKINIEINIDDFSRSDVQVAKSKTMNDSRENQNSMTLSKFQAKRGIVTGNYLRTYPTNEDIAIELEKGIEAILPKKNQLPKDSFFPGQKNIKFIITETSKKEGKVTITLSRTHPLFVEELLKTLVPEINQDIIKVYRTVREPGFRTKIAVYTERSDVDPVSLCLGVKTQNIQNLKAELNGEFVDIVKYSKDIKEFIKNSITSAKIEFVQVTDEEKKTALAIVSEKDLVFAIGKKGTNIKLLNRLVDWNVSIRSREQIDKDETITDSIKKQIDYMSTNKHEGSEITEIKQIPNMSQDLLEILVRNKIEDVEELISMDDEQVKNLKGMTFENFKNLKKILNELDIQEIDDFDIKKAPPTAPAPAQPAPQVEAVSSQEDEEDDEVEFVYQLPFSEAVKTILKKHNIEKIIDFVEIVDEGDDELIKLGFSEEQIEEINAVINENVEFDDNEE